jgi:hypothetical protein
MVCRRRKRRWWEGGKEKRAVPLGVVEVVVVLVVGSVDVLRLSVPIVSVDFVEVSIASSSPLPRGWTNAVLSDGNMKELS